MAGGAIKVYNGDVVKSDTTVSHTVKAELQAAVRPLEDVPEWEKDWHPGSDEKVWDLVHPSLFPIVYGWTRALGKGKGFVTLENCIARCGDGNVLEKQKAPDGGYTKSITLPERRRGRSMTHSTQLYRVMMCHTTSRITHHMSHIKSFPHHPHHYRPSPHATHIQHTLSQQARQWCRT